MKDRYCMFPRSNGVYYIEDLNTGRQTSLRTKDKAEARQLTAARNQAAAQPMLNVAMAKTYLMGKSEHLANRTWGQVMADKTERHQRESEPSSLKRWEKVCRSAPFQLLANLPVIETESEHFMAVLRHPKAGNSTIKYLRIMHNYTLDMGWLLHPVLTKKTWPKVKTKDQRGITQTEHEAILRLAKEREEECDYYRLLWETGGSQTDIATLDADRIDWEQKTLLYRRVKTQNTGYEFAKVRLGVAMCEILARRPQSGPLFPNLAKMSLEHRARMFKRRCEKLEFKGITLHCYRYAWAERARKAEVPVRVAMETLGHQSKAVHQAYAKKVEIDVFPLEYYQKLKDEKIIEFQQFANTPSRQSDKGKDHYGEKKAG